VTSKTYTDKDRETKKLYYLKNKARILEAARLWREKNPARARESNRVWREKNAGQKAASRRAWYETNRDVVLARQAERYRNLSDAVVRSMFCAGSGLQSRDVPNELLPAIRTTVLINRVLRKQRTVK